MKEQRRNISFKQVKSLWAVNNKLLLDFTPLYQLSTIRGSEKSLGEHRRYILTQIIRIIKKANWKKALLRKRIYHKNPQMKFARKFQYFVICNL